MVLLTVKTYVNKIYMFEEQVQELRIYTISDVRGLSTLYNSLLNILEGASLYTFIKTKQ